MWDAPRMAADKVFQQCLSSAFPSTKEHSEFLLKVPFFLHLCTCEHTPEGNNSPYVFLVVCLMAFSHSI